MAFDFLKKGMDALIGQAKRAKKTVEVRGGPTPILSLESRLAIPKMKGLIERMGERFVPPALPSLQEKTVLEWGEWPLHFKNPIQAKKPKLFYGVIVGNSHQTKVLQSESPYLIQANFKSIPFESGFFDCVLCRLATPAQGDVISLFKELGRVLAPEGCALVLDFHPFGLYAKSGAVRLRSVQATIRGLEDYYKMCRMAGLQITEVREGFFDDTLRNQFVTPQEMSVFREIKGTPLVLFLKMIKLRPSVHGPRSPV
ncbi:MAG: methyltransferase domain-containing protein [Deltaproteobacteria bacterium]|nr:methyltransferase domain-containing protein [Deltaproteobacteria bacterium]